jgi:hypothetical protein
MAGEDKELTAIGSIMSALQPLTAQERSRVLEYVLKRLQPACPGSQPDSSPCQAEQRRSQTDVPG